MDPLINKYSVWKRILHKFQARRDIPFRKKFFIGYDLHGNTYWEFSPDGNLQRLRRKMEPYQEYMFKADYFSTVPPPWLQWLRRTRNVPPNLQELMQEEARQQNIKALAQQADAKWMHEKMRLETEEKLKLDNELNKVKQQKLLHDEELSKYTGSLDDKVPDNDNDTSGPKLESNHTHNPWEEADNQKDNPIESANIKIRR